MRILCMLDTRSNVYLLFRFDKKINFSNEMKSNFDWPPVTQADNAWVEYAMLHTQLVTPNHWLVTQRMDMRNMH